jgi:TolA-binding protein
MLEEMTNMMFSPTVIGFVVAAVLCFLAGRFLASGGARQREDTLKRDLLEAKASVPQLESTVRNREQLIARLEEEVQDLKVRTSESLQVQEEKTNALRRAERELKNLTSELKTAMTATASSWTVSRTKQPTSRTSRKSASSFGVWKVSTRSSRPRSSRGMPALRNWKPRPLPRKAARIWNPPGQSP